MKQWLLTKSFASPCIYHHSQFGNATGNPYEFDKNFMDGGGGWNSQTEQNLTISVDAGRATRFLQNGASSQRVAWPTYAALQNYTTIFNPTGQPYMSNFNFSESCALRTVMCCYINDRNTGGPVANGNANVCNNDLRGGRHSTHVQRGLAVYDPTVPAYCTGFSWSSDNTSASYQYRGNSLADLAFGTLLNKKYVKNIPGAPMCGCLEQMPVVTNSSCRQVTVTNEQWQLTNSGGKLTFKQLSATVSFNDCGQTLLSYYTNANVSSSAEQAQVALRIVGPGGCTAANTNFTSERLIMAPGTTRAFVGVDATVWTQVAGLSQLYYPTQTYNMTLRDAYFRQLLASAATPYPIIYRYCMSCKPTHQHIFYVRLSPIPTTYNFLNLFMNNWTNVNNTLNMDFELYSNINDALVRNQTGRWQVCNYNDPSGEIGFPRDCDPVTLNICQWNSYTTGMCWGYDYSPVSHGFYVHK